MMRYLIAIIVVFIIGGLLGAMDADARSEIIQWERLAPFYADGFTINQRADTSIRFTVTPEHHYWIDEDGERHEWGNGVRHQPIVSVGESPYSERLEIPWDGCVRISATLVTPPMDLDGDGETDSPFRSEPSNEIIRGECLDPAPGPIAVPEPGTAALLSSGFAVLAMMNLRRDGYGHR